MRAVILAAGFGRRMRPLSDATHKTLLRVAGKTIIGRIMDGLIANGIRETAIVTGYRAEELTDYLRAEYPDHAFHFIHNARYQETNNIFEPAVLTRLIQSPHSDVALVDHYRTGMDATVVSISNGVVTSVITPHLQQRDFSFSSKYKTLNIYRFSKELCSGQSQRLLTFYARFIDDNCYYELILGIMIYMRQAQIDAEIVEGELWAEVDDPNDLHAAEFIFDRPRRGAILERTMGGYWAHRVLDFCFLRNMYFPTAAVLAEIRNSAAALIQNYESKQEILNEKLSYLLLCDPACVQVLNGTSQIYPFLRPQFFLTGRGAKALIPAPTFGEYKATFPLHETYADNGRFRMEDVAVQAEGAAVIVFVAPNSPTGTTCDPSEIIAFARKHPGKTVLIDESFLAFHTGELCGSGSVIRWLEREPLDNVCVVCGLSKTLGIPGARLGYVYSRNREFLRELGDDLPIWNLNSFAEFVMEVSLKHREGIGESLRATAHDREAFREQLPALDAVESVWPGGGNFLLVRFRWSIARARCEAEKLLSEHSIYIKDVSARFTDGGARWRPAVRLPEENISFCERIPRS